MDMISLYIKNQVVVKKNQGVFLFFQEVPGALANVNYQLGKVKIRLNINIVCFNLIMRGLLAQQVKCHNFSKFKIFQF